MVDVNDEVILMRVSVVDQFIKGKNEYIST